ncbi:MAG: hypothetical protein V3U71_04020 [Cocleimonas sp.]
MMAIFQKEKYPKDVITEKCFSVILQKIENELQTVKKEIALNSLQPNAIKTKNLQEERNKIIIEGRAVLDKVEANLIEGTLKERLKVQYSELLIEENTITF